MQDVGDVWSKPVNGIQGRLTFSKGDVVVGTRIIKVYLELRNISDVLNPIEIPYDPTKSVRGELFNSAGKPVPKANVPADIMSPSPFTLALPYDSTLRFDVTARGYGIMPHQGSLIGLHSGAWLVKDDELSNCYLGATFEVRPESKRNHGRVWSGILEIPRTRIVLHQ